MPLTMKSWAGRELVHRLALAVGKSLFLSWDLRLVGRLVVAIGWGLRNAGLF